MSQDIGGNDVSLSNYRGKVLLIVNVASNWYSFFLFFLEVFLISRTSNRELRFHSTKLDLCLKVFDRVSSYPGFVYFLFL